MLLEPSKTRYDLEFSVSKIAVRTNPSFWLIALFIGWNDHGGIIENLILILCVFVSVLIHELGHAAAARYFGGYDVRVILYGMGGMMLNNHALSRKEKLIELFCGPAAGFALSTISLIILQLGSGVNAINYAYNALVFLFRINLFWSLLNLLPIYPLDGGQIMKELIFAKRPWDGMGLILKISMAISVAAAAFFTVLILIALASGRSSGAWMPALIFVALALANYQMFRNPGVGDESDQHYNSWEKDSDWWKK